MYFWQAHYNLNLTTIAKNVATKSKITTMTSAVCLLRAFLKLSKFIFEKALTKQTTTATNAAGTDTATAIGLWSTKFLRSFGYWWSRLLQCYCFPSF